MLASVSHAPKTGNRTSGHEQSVCVCVLEIQTQGGLEKNEGTMTERTSIGSFGSKAGVFFFLSFKFSFLFLL